MAFPKIRAERVQFMSSLICWEDHASDGGNDWLFVTS